MPSEPENFNLTLNEFCIRLSNTDSRVELIGGFEHSERTAGNFNGTHDEFSARYAAFITKPV